MLNVMRPYALVLLASWAILLPCQASAQPLFGHTTSLELAVSDADYVATGKIVAIDEEVDDWIVTLEVEETLKGEHQARREIRLDQPEHVISRWQEEATPILVALHEDVSRVPGEWVVGLGDESHVLTAELELLSRGDEILESAREAIRLMPGVTRMRGFQLSVPREVVVDTSWVEYYETRGRLVVKVPVDSRLEEHAHQRLQSDNSIHRGEAARALRYFKSQSNIDVVMPLLADPEVANMQRDGVRVRRYVIREAALETLLYWGLEVEAPIIEEEVEVAP